MLSEKRLRDEVVFVQQEEVSPILCTERGFVRHKGFGRSKAHGALRKTHTQEWLGALIDSRRVSEDWKQTLQMLSCIEVILLFCTGWCGGTQGPLAQPNTPGWAFLNKRHC